MNAIVDFFNLVVFSAFGVPVTLLELFGFITGALCVWAVAKQYKWNWYVGAANGVAFAFLFFEVGLYADAFLQLIFIAMNIFGVFAWTFGGKDGKNTLRVRKVFGKEIGILLPLTAVATIGAAMFLHTQTDSNVYWFDAAVLTMSVLATYGQAKKILESWYVWIVVDVISIPLYFYKGLILTALLYGIFLTLCVIGLVKWRKDLQKGADGTGTAVSEKEEALA